MNYVIDEAGLQDYQDVEVFIQDVVPPPAAASPSPGPSPPPVDDDDDDGGNGGSGRCDPISDPGCR